MAKNGIIGHNGRPPWYDPKSKRYYFSHVTEGHSIIIGKRSYDLFGHKYIAKKIYPVSRETMTLSEAITATQDEDMVFIAGGYSLLVQTMEMISGVYMAKINENYKGSVYYPEMSKDLKLKYVVPVRNSNVSLHYYEREWAYD